MDVDVTQDAAEQKALSFDERVSRLYAAFEEAFKPEEYEPRECWLVEVYNDYIIAREHAMFYRVLYTIDQTTVTFAPRDNWQLVEKEWIDIMMPDDTLVSYGGEVKALGNGLTGICVARFSDSSDPDLMKDYFDAETDFDIEDGEKLSIYFDHGMDDLLNNKRLGREPIEIKDAGVFLQHQLDLRDEYEAAIYKLAEMGKLGASSGPAQHLVRRERKGNAFHITHWPLKEVSYTVRPADHKNSVLPMKSLARIDLKSYLDNQPIEPEPTPEALPEVTPVTADAAGAEVKTEVVIISQPEIKEGAIMTEQVNNAPAQDEAEKGRLSMLEGQMKAMGDTLTAFMQKLEASPALKNAGYLSDGDATTPKVKSFGDFLLSIWRGDTTRLKSIYGATKALSEDSGVAGGYLVPEDYSGQLVQTINESSAVLNLITPIPVNVRSGNWPVLDFSDAPTAGQGDSGMNAGMTAARRTDGGSFTATQPKFGSIGWQVSDMASGYVPVDNELIADSPTSIEQLLRRLIASVVGARKEYAILRGTGAGEPLGILNNSSTLVQITPANNNVFAYADALNMIARFKPLGDRRKAAWVAHPSTLPDIGAFEVGTGGAVYVTNLSQPVQGMPLLGYPLLFSEHLPQANNSGHIILASFDDYLLWERGQIAIDFSEHYLFGTGQSAWRFSNRCDGKPGLIGTITAADPQGSYTVGPFVSFND